MMTWNENSIRYMLQAKSSGMSYQQIAKKFGTTPESVRAKYRKIKKQDPTNNKDAARQYKSPIQPLTLDLHDCIVASDFHTPGESEKAIQTLIEYANKNKIKHLIIGGDFWNQDAVSRWELKDPTMSMPYEIEKGVKLINRLTKHMNLYFVRGNHDIRMCQAINYALTYSEWMKSIVGNKFNRTVFVTDFDYLYLKSHNAKFRICHPNIYSKVKGTQVAMLAHDLQEHVMMGHQHFFSISTNKTGKFMCIDLGCMCDVKKFLYKNAATSKCPEWENGFVHVKNGKIHPITWYTF